MNKLIKKRVIELLDKIFNNYLSENEHMQVNDELSQLIVDPNWSYYIFWSNNYHNEDGSLNYDKFFQKISEYENSEEYIRNNYIISLVYDLLQKNFQLKSEMDIVNELNKLIPHQDWINCLFVSKSCFLENGVFSAKEFLTLMDLIKFES